MAALCEMKLNLQLAKSQDPPIWVLSSPEAEIPLAFVDELEDEEGQEILRLLRQRWARPRGCWCALRGADSHGAELPVRDRAAGQRAELPGQAGLKILIRDSPGSEPGIARFGK